MLTVLPAALTNIRSESVKVIDRASVLKALIIDPDLNVVFVVRATTRTGRWQNRSASRARSVASQAVSA